MKNKLLLLLLIVSLIGCKERNQFRPVNLKCEGTTNPINIARTNPLFSWQFNDSSNGFMQSAYLIIVASDVKLLNEKEADLWNSGKIASNQSNYIEYMGKAFKPSTRYYWTIKTWSNKNKESVFAEPASFETGILEAENWKANWVKPPKSLNEASSILFRKEFELKSKIKEARIYATALGAYEIYLNGKKVGNQYLAPGWSNFLKRIQYQVFDITSELKEGKNAVGFLTGKFWNSSKDAANPFNHGIIMQLKVVYDDNTIEWFNSGNGWKIAQSPVTNCGFDSGEKYDSRLEKEGWSTAGYNESNWLNATSEKNNLNLVCQQIQPIIVHKELKPEKTVSSNKNSIVFDFGETLPGWVKLKIKGKEGQQICVSYLSTYNNGDAKSGNIIATDEYTCKSSNAIEWEPVFSYHVFRYVEVTGENIDKNDIVARMAYPDIDQTGRFACSNDLINSIYRNIVRSGRNSMTGLLTALPDEDAAKASPVSLSSFAATSLYTFNMDKAYDKYMIDLYNFQAANGKIQIFTKNGANSPGWPEVVVELPWQTYLFTGDSRLLKKSHKTMLAWHQSEMRESDAQAPPYMHDMDGVGDLYELDTTRIRPIGSCYYFYSTTLMGKIEEALGKSDDAISFGELAGFTKDQFNQTYLKYRIARYWSGTQTAHILPLAVGLTPMSHGQRVADFIAANIKQRGIHPSTGILATRFLLPILSEYNHHDLAYKLITQTTKPSWGYMVKRGSSTIWGNWDGMDDASKYQLALASAGEWLYGYLAGIKPDEKNPGFKHSFICPLPVGDLKWAEASLNTSYGILSVHWEFKDKTFEVNTEIPSNTWSTISLPVKNTKTTKILVDDNLILENSKATKSCPESVKFKGFDSKYAVFEVGSGKYKFVVE